MHNILWRLVAEEERNVPESEDTGAFLSKAAIGVTTQKPSSKSARKKNIPKYIALMGVPGCGKSTFARFLTGKQSDTTPTSVRWTHVSQDDVGRIAFSDVVGRSSATVGHGKLGGIIVDCCNVQTRDQLQLLKTIHQPAKSMTALVFFDTNVESCIARVRARLDHPNIPFGKGDRIVRGFSSRLEQPTEKERQNLFGHGEVVRSQEYVNSLLRKWGIPVS
jgi:predicted kinase